MEQEKMENSSARRQKDILIEIKWRQKIMKSYQFHTMNLSALTRKFRCRLQGWHHLRGWGQGEQLPATPILRVVLQASPSSCPQNLHPCLFSPSSCSCSSTYYHLSGIRASPCCPCQQQLWTYCSIIYAERCQRPAWRGKSLTDVGLPICVGID